jgi:ATP-dependent Zn protease
MEDFVKATLTKVYGLENRCGEISAEKKEEIAYHEAGHAVIAEVLKAECMGMVSLSSNSLGDMGGFALRCKQLDRRAHEILVSLGGKAASEMKFGRLASGTSSDLESAIGHLVSSISSVASLGMNQLALPRVSDSENYLAGRENVVHAELERYMFKAKEIIAANREFLDKIAAELLEKHFASAPATGDTVIMDADEMPITEPDDGLRLILEEAIASEQTEKSVNADATIIMPELPSESEGENICSDEEMFKLFNEDEED